MDLLVTITLAIGALAICIDATTLKFNSYLTMDVDHKPPEIMRISDKHLEIKYLDMQIDNFDPQNFATFKMAYYENDEFVTNNNGPIFIFIGGEWNITEDMLLGGHMFDMAKELNGSLLYPEHRYYGVSIPIDNHMNATTDNLRILSIEQSLADLASFIVQIKRNDARYTDSKVILVGGSYSATMATWFRKRYPHLAVGAWSSSAPVLAKAAFIEYKEIVGASIRSVGGTACYDRLANGIAAAEALIANSQTARFNELFGACPGFGSHPLDIPLLFSSVSNVFSGYVQYHGRVNVSIEEACQFLLLNQVEPTELEESRDLVELARFFRAHLEDDEDVCHPDYPNLVAIYSVPLVSDSRSWFYQTCSEFGWYQTSESEFHPFGASFPVDLYFQMCRDVFDGRFGANATRAAIDRTNVIFGGWNLDVSNVYFTNGLLDPWRAMGIQEDLNESSPADVIPGASHCADLASISSRDEPEMRLVKERIHSLVRRWLGLESIVEF